MNEDDDFDPFAETAKSNQVAARQSEYHLKRFDRQEEATTSEYSRSSLRFCVGRREGRTEGELEKGRRRWTSTTCPACSIHPLGWCERS